MRLLIAGCGYVGTELGRQIRGQIGGQVGADAGDLVWGLRRNPSALPPPILPLAGDLLDPELHHLLPKVDAVVYAAAADTSTAEGYRRAYVEGVRNLQRALLAAESPVERFLFVSSTAVWGDAGGAWIDEETPTTPDNFRGEIILEGEEAVRSGPFPTTVLRLGGIYGPGRNRLIERVRSGEARCPNDGGEGSPLWSNRIHRDDAAGALAHLLRLEAPEALYIGVDEEPAPLCDVYREVAALLGVTPPERSVGPSRGAGGDPERSNKRCSSRRLRASGYRFRFPSYREGYRSAIAAWQAEGER